MRFGVVVFPGSNCDEDAFHAAMDLFGQEAMPLAQGSRPQGR
jgi:phosphoribosylformylglycinamidine synthase